MALLPYVVCNLLLLSSIAAFYLPGLAPVNYCRAGDDNGKSCKNEIPLYVNRLNTEESVIPFEYHHFDFCLSDETQSPVENLGQVVFGERIRPSPYKLNFLEDVKCRAVCTKDYKGSDPEAIKKLNLLKMGMALNYQHHWILDNMPVTWCYLVNEGGKTYCSTGFPMGCQVRKYLIKPASIHHQNKDNLDCSARNNQLKIPNTLAGDETFSITYTYSVTFKKNNTIKWSSRWDYILESMPILNSPVIVLFLSGMVVMILLWTLHKDIARYNQMECGKDAQEEFGWKLVHGDVFRPPRQRMLLAVFLGSGAQVFGMTLVTLSFACLGFLSPANSGALMTCALVVWVLLGAAAGYVSARIYKSFGGRRWKSNILLTSMVCPGVVFSLFFIMNLVLWGKGSSAALPFSTLVALLALWFGVSVPLTFIGAYFGFRKRILDHPVRTNQIPRQIPEQSLYTQPITGIIIGGVLPFGCIFIQLFFILNSLWSSQMYHMFGFLFLVFVILVITCSETTILLCYFHLCAEDYHWWWRAFLSSGSTAGYLFIYCCHYFVTKLNIEDAASTFLYFGYTFIMVFLFFLLTGTIGFMACFWFVRKIYSIVKVDPIKNIL
ncbi:transmembrane 9 superfamily member 2-like isoform X2 [Aricia agestis]|uniref:transmembrane 9 superfamily member 2-like isoform X2 n=1 Tax=Aricia agestis TaxID=91739 RepID=UPI001C20A9B9|nr:transmembrane 9 superfamily member 2-like isoform X2 [Aricia agestis]